MCASLDDVEPSLAERLENGDVALVGGGDEGTAHLLEGAAVGDHLDELRQYC